MSQINDLKNELHYNHQLINQYLSWAIYKHSDV